MSSGGRTSGDDGGGVTRAQGVGSGDTHDDPGSCWTMSLRRVLLVSTVLPLSAVMIEPTGPYHHHHPEPAVPKTARDPEAVLAMFRRGAFTSVRALTEAIQRFLDHWNDDCKPFVWVKTADEILATLHRQRSLETVH